LFVGVATEAPIVSAVVAAADSAGRPALLVLTAPSATTLAVVAMHQVSATDSDAPAWQVAWREEMSSHAPISSIAEVVVEQRLLIAELPDAVGKQLGRPVVVVATAQGAVGFADER
jgi:hypothetical protein